MKPSIPVFFVVLAVLVAVPTCAAAQAGPVKRVVPATAGTSSPGPAGTVETAARKAFGEADFPWYDAEREEFRPMDIPYEEAPSEARALGSGGFSLMVFMVYGFLALILGVVAYVIYRLLRELQVDLTDADPVRKAEYSARLDDLPIPVEVGAGDFLSEAARRMALADFRGAVKYLYAHQLVVLDRAHAIRLERGKTNRQYLGEAERQSLVEAAAILRESIAVFESSFFGDRQPTAEQMATLWAGQERLDRLALGGTPASR